MFAIYKRELKSNLNSFIGLLFIGVVLFFIGLYYTVYNLTYGYPYFSYVVGNIVYVFLISVPILCMRILSEERHNKTDQLILTAPVSVGGIVMGKFMALTTIFAVPTLISCIYPLILTQFGTVALGESYLAILAFFLYGVTCIAICMLISSLTESQVISAILSFGILFLGYMMRSIISIVSSSENLLTKILGYFDLYTPFGEMLNGTLNLNGVVYFLSVVVLALFLTVQSIQKRRYSVSVKHLSAGAYSTGLIALVVAVVAVINVIIGEMPDSLTAIDVTSQKLYSLTDQSKEFVKKIEEDVTIYVLVSEESKDNLLDQTLQRYDDLSDHITVEYVDPTVNPRFHTQYTDSSISLNSLIVVGEERYKVVDAADVYTTDYTTGSSGYDGEGLITGALAYVTSEDAPMLYITEGHGEYSLSTTFASGLNKQNMSYQTINLMDYDEVPKDASCLLLNAPGNDISAIDKDKIIAYLEKGGNVVIVLPLTDAGVTLPNLEALLEYMGMAPVEGIVVDTDQSYYYQNPFYLLPDVEYHAYTSGVYGNYYVFAPYSTGIAIPEEAVEGMTYTSFLNSSDTSYSKVDLSSTVYLDKAEEDIAGPFSLGVKAVKEIVPEDGLEMTEATMIVLGSDMFFRDDVNQMVGGSNQMIFNNIMGSFSEHEASVSIPAKNYDLTYMMISQDNIITIGAIVTLVLPVGCLVLGFVIWFRRRKR